MRHDDSRTFSLSPLPGLLSLRQGHFDFDVADWLLPFQTSPFAFVINNNIDVNATIMTLHDSVLSIPSFI